MVLPNAAFDARFDPQGKELLYTGPSIEQPFRKGQVSSAARQVWVYDAANGVHRRLVNDVHESRDAVWAPSGDIYYLGEASGSLNVWRASPKERPPVQITRFAGDPVRSLSISQSGDLAFSFGGEIYRLRAGAEEPERIERQCAAHRLPGRDRRAQLELHRFRAFADRQGDRARGARRHLRRLDERQIRQAHHPHAGRRAQPHLLARWPPARLCGRARRALEPL